MILDICIKPLKERHSAADEQNHILAKSKKSEGHNCHVFKGLQNRVKVSRLLALSYLSHRTNLKWVTSADIMLPDSLLAADDIHFL